MRRRLLVIDGEEGVVEVGGEWTYTFPSLPGELKGMVSFLLWFAWGGVLTRIVAGHGDV